MTDLGTKKEQKQVQKRGFSMHPIKGPPNEEVPMEKYEYETIHLLPGSAALEGELNNLGREGYHLIATIPIVQITYNGPEQTELSGGTQLIFERRKEIN